VTFIQEDAASTRITLKSELINEHTPAELQAFVAERSGMTQGWNGSLDRLEERLERGVI